MTIVGLSSGVSRTLSDNGWSVFLYFILSERSLPMSLCLLHRVTRVGACFCVPLILIYKCWSVFLCVSYTACQVLVCVLEYLLQYLTNVGLCALVSFTE